MKEKYSGRVRQGALNGRINTTNTVMGVVVVWQGGGSAGNTSIRCVIGKGESALTGRREGRGERGGSR